MNQTESEFRARLETYSGPLDLLLFLIKKDEVDIFDIPLARVIGQYRLYLDVLKDIDPNSCGEFVVLFAQLIEMKSKLLLPRDVVDGEEEDLDDPRLELVQQLLEFKRYKERALILEERFEEFRRRYRRPPVELPELEIDYSAPLDLGKVTVWDLLRVFQRLELSRGHEGPHRVVLRDRPIGEYIGDIQAILAPAPERSLRFDRLFDRIVDRYDAIGVLLAVLEMCKSYRLVLRPSEEEGDDAIIVRLRTEEEREAYEAMLRELDAADNLDVSEEHLLRGEGDDGTKRTDQRGRRSRRGSCSAIDSRGARRSEPGAHPTCRRHGEFSRRKRVRR